MGNIIKKIQAGTITYDIEPANAAELDVTNKAPTLAWNTTSTIATVNGTDITVKMPANPDTKVTVDTAMSSTSTNPVQNKVIYSALSGKASTAAASTTTAGLMSKDDKIKLDSIPEKATTVAIGGTGYVTSNLLAQQLYVNGGHNHDTVYQAKDADLTAIAGLTGTSGLLKKTAANSWTLDTNSYLTSHQTIVQDGIVGSAVYHYAECTTAAGTAAKTANVLMGTPKPNTQGLRVIVKFTNKNTASTPTLNIDGAGAKNIFHNGAQITTGTNKGLLYGACEFVFDGTQWLLVGNYVDSNTTYSKANATGNTTTVASNSHIHSVTASGTLNSTGSHSHTFTGSSVNTSEVSAHSHSVTASGTLNSTGSHSHAITVTPSTKTLTYVSGLGTTPCTSASSHTHSISATAATITGNITGSYTNGVLTLSSGNVTYVSAVTKTGSAGSHSHTISLATSTQTIATGISSATSTATGSHSHTFTGSSVDTGTAGKHSHTVTAAGTLNSTGSHSHTFTGSAVNSGTPSGTTATTTVPTSGHTHGLK